LQLSWLAGFWVGLRGITCELFLGIDLLFCWLLALYFFWMLVGLALRGLFAMVAFQFAAC